MFDIINYIGVGRENAVTRQELSAVLNLPDRAVRRLIQEARDRGEIIINAQDGAGYYLTNDVGEMKRQMAQNKSRALSVLRQQKYLRQRIAEAENKQQITIDGTVGYG